MDQHVIVLLPIVVLVFIGASLFRARVLAYRDVVPEARSLLCSRFEKRTYVGERSDYFVRGTKLGPIEELVVRRDVALLKKQGISCVLEYRDKSGGIIIEDEKFKERLAAYSHHIEEQVHSVGWRLKKRVHLGAPYAYTSEYYIVRRRTEPHKPKPGDELTFV